MFDAGEPDEVELAERARYASLLPQDPGEPGDTPNLTTGALAQGAYRDVGGKLNSMWETLGEPMAIAEEMVSPLAPLTRPIGQYALHKSGIPELLNSWEEASPDSFENAKAGMGFLQTIPALHTFSRTLPRVVNAGTDNLATRLDGSDIHGNNPTNSGGFYGGDPLGGIMQGYNFEEHMRQLLSPQAIANHERRGFGQRERWVGEGRRSKTPPSASQQVGQTAHYGIQISEASPQPGVRHRET
jgi:hypothetical protein